MYKNFPNNFLPTKELPKRRQNYWILSEIFISLFIIVEKSCYEKVDSDVAWC